MDLPRIISVDDHVVEPPSLWQERLPASLRDRAPRVDRVRGRYEPGARGGWVEADDGDWADLWRFGDFEMSIIPGFAAAGMDQNDLDWVPLTYEMMRPGCYQQNARLADMDLNHTEAGLAFPTFPRFCGQTFHEHPDRKLGLACIQVYNDWMIDEWCAGAGYGRLIPLTLVPMWDPDLAADEVRRCADKGAHAVAFSENPARLKLPSIFTDHWGPFFAACEQTDTVINLHIGSSSTFPMTSLDAPRAVSLGLTYQGAAHALCDWLTCGKLEEFPELRVALSEGQIGWMPFLLEKLDGVWHERAAYGEIERLPQPPSHYMRQIYGCLFDDQIGLEMRDRIGIDQIMFEVDYPHGDSTWPNTLGKVKRLVAAAGLTDEETYALLRGNAIRCYGLDRYGIVS